MTWNPVTLGQTQLKNIIGENSKMMKFLKGSYLVLLFFLVILAATCARVVVKPGLTFGPSEAKWVDKTLKKMTLEEKIGQMVACRYSGHFVNRDSDYLERLKSLIVNRKIGGLILFGGEVYETAYLTNTAQEMSHIVVSMESYHVGPQ